MTTDHQPENWFHEAGSDDCPHGAEPDRNSDAWDVWADRHTGSPQDVYICLEAPAGEACGSCSSEEGEMVPWAACRERARTKAQFVRERQAAHERITVQVAGLGCLERECEEFFDDDGEEIPGKETCSHFSDMEICVGCSEPPNRGEFEVVVGWADCKQLVPTP